MSPFFPVTGNSHPFLVFIADKNIAFELNVPFLFQEPKIRVSSSVKGDYEKTILPIFLGNAKLEYKSANKREAQLVDIIQTIKIKGGGQQYPPAVLVWSCVV